LCWTSHNCAAVFLFGTLLFPSVAVAGELVILANPDRLGQLSALPDSPEPVDITARAEFEERLVSIDINRQQLDQIVLVLEDKTGVFYFWSEDILRWRLRLPDARAAIVFKGEEYFSLASISALSYAYDPKLLTLQLEISPQAFYETTKFTETALGTPATKANAGGFINYDLLAAFSQDTTQRSGQFELGYFNRLGVGTGNLLAEHLGQQTHLTRLDTTWTTDYPEKMRTLHLGDAISTAGSWGRSVRFGGIQFGSNYATQPGFVRFPAQKAVGQAVLPSTVDVFINNTLVSHQRVPPGPFSISNLPVITGAGEVQLVVTDMLGREQRVSQPIYISQALLREGSANYSAELGWVRENFGINSNDYGSALASATYRRGLSEYFTGEVHAEAMRNQVVLGAGGDTLIPLLGTVNTYLAANRTNLHSGRMVLLGIERQAQPWSLGLRTQWASSGFTQAGVQSVQLSSSQVSSVNLSYAALSRGSFGVAFVNQRNSGQAASNIGTFSYSVSLRKLGSLGISASHSFKGEANSGIFVLLSISLNQTTSLSVSSQARFGKGVASSPDLTTTLQRNLPSGEGHGYRLQGRSDGAKEVSYSRQNNVATYTMEAAQNNGLTAARLSVSGGVALFGGDAFMSRRIDQSFAVVRIPDYPNVRILADNQPAGRTNKQGNALIPGLRAYDSNVIAIDQRDLPLDSEINTLKLEAVPYFRSGIEIKFPIKHSRGATLKILLEDGKPIPVGSLVQQIGKIESYTVGYEGEVYVVDLAETTMLRATWNKQSCEFVVRYIASADPLPDLGNFICKGVTP
jgi:outer membrane usher protein